MAAQISGQRTEPYTYESFSGTKEGEKNNFLWWCAGAHQRILKQYPSEYSKYAGLGGILIATFVLAAISSGYALYTVFNNLPASIFFAVIWGLIIFNFDRFLVSTMRKYGVSSSRQLYVALPRMLLACLIGITIARPLELKVFEKEINTKVSDNMHRKILLNDSILQLESSAQMNTARNERARLTARKQSIEDTLHRLQQSYVQEADGTGGSGKRGIENLTRLKMDAYQEANVAAAGELQSLNANLAMHDSILNAAQASLQIKRKEYEAALVSNVGFLERNKALSDLQQEESSVFWACLMLSLLIILLEIAPVLSKMIMQVGPYDIALAKEELLQMARSEDELIREKSVVLEKMKRFYSNKKSVSDEFLDNLTELQRKSIKADLEKWERGEQTSASLKKDSLEDLMKGIKEKYNISEEHLL